MRPERWQQVEPIYHAALEMEADQRAAFLAEACAGDEALRREVDSLLRFDQRAEGFIEAPALEVAARMFASEEKLEGVEFQDDPAAVERIGPYKILREIGRGGMGAVFLAERDDEQYKKQVAIKLIKRGMDSDAILHRFLAERQILARLEHPNIARMLDGGATANGLPYFVMEYIEGLPIDDFADQRKLSITERLNLFLQVSAAVQHSHQHLVVHRDIKPNNIIVTADGTAKLLDFGIAKIVTPDTRIAETMSARGWMTPEYSSPEQLRGEAITTQSDVYSLGVVLYKLLTGRSPYRSEKRSANEMAEVISGSDPDRPSTAAVRVAPVTVREDAPTFVSPDVISELREGTPEKLRRRLSGDLDNIVLMAMHKEKDLRYRSVAGLADDIRRHLEGRTVVARKDTFTYRASKFIRRNKVAVAAAAIIVLILIGSTIVTAWQARVARRAQAQAGRRFQEVRKLARSVVFDYHDRIRDLAGSTPVREKIVSDALDYLNSLAEDARDDASLQAEIADAYEKISEIQGGMGLANLGDTAGAIESLRKCLQIRQSLLAANSHDSGLRVKTAQAFLYLAALLGQRGDSEGAAESYRNAVSMAEGLISMDPTNSDFQYQAANSYGSLGNFLIDKGDWKGALENEQKALNLFTSILADDPQNKAIRRSIVICHNLNAQILVELNDITQALANSDKAIEIATKLSGEDQTNADLRRLLAICYYSSGDALEIGGRLADALTSFRKYAAITEELSAADPKNMRSLLDRAFAYWHIGQILLKTGDKSGAVEHLRRSLDIRRSVYDADPGDLYKRGVLIEGMGTMVNAYTEARNISAALNESRKAMEMLAKTDENSEFANIRGTCAMARKNIAMALETAAKSSPGQRKRMGEEARSQYQRCLEILLDMQSKGTLSPSDAPLIEEARQGVARCDLLIR